MKTDCAEITLRAYAKVNLFLDITGVLPSGYHSLNTIMQQIELSDEVSISLSGGCGIKIFCDDARIPLGEGNIAFKAAAAFLKKLGENAEIFIDIKKHIPIEAGLGGSSADGAAVLLGLNKLFGEPFTVSELCEIGSVLGADVPFCITGGTLACTGIGDCFTPTEPLPDCFLLVVKPEFNCSTKSAYAAYDRCSKPRKADYSGFLDALESRSLKGVASRLYNVFEALYSDERIGKIRTELLQSGALGACMTGSGSAVFGIFDKLETAKNAQKSIPYTMKFLSKPLNTIENKTVMW